MNLTGYKTYITGIVGIVVAAGAHLSGDLPLADALRAALECILAMFIRNGISTENSK